MVMFGGTTSPRRQVPAGLIDEEYGVCAGRDGGGDLHQVQVHRLVLQVGRIRLHPSPVSG